MSYGDQTRPHQRSCQEYRDDVPANEHDQILRVGMVWKYVWGGAQRLHDRQTGKLDQFQSISAWHFLRSLPRRSSIFLVLPAKRANNHKTVNI